MVERSAHNRLVVGSIPTEPRTCDFLTEDFSIREMLEVLMGPEGKRKLRLRHKTNEELFVLFDSQLVLRHRSRDALAEARRVLKHYQAFLGDYPPSPELAATFLAKFSERKPNTLYRYHSIIQGFQSWYGEPLDSKIKVPESLPEYVEDGDLEKLKAAMASKKTHKNKIERNLAIIETDKKTGLRRKELAGLNVADVNVERQYLIVRQGKGQKDRIIDLSPTLIRRLEPFMKGKRPQDSLFGVSAETISGIIHWAAVKAGVNIHTHSLRDYFATRLIDNGSDIEVVRRLLGHTSLENTRRYLARTDKQRRDAIMSLDSRTTARTESESHNEAASTISRDEIATTNAAARSGRTQTPETETAHLAEIRTLAVTLAQNTSVPSVTDKGLWRELPIVEPGTFHLALGTTTLRTDGTLAVAYGRPRAGADPHLERSLEAHLGSSGMDRFSNLLRDGGTLSVWSDRVGHYSAATLDLLKLALNKISKTKLKAFVVVPTEPGLTKWFAITAWHDAMENARGHAWLDKHVV